MTARGTARLLAAALIVAGIQMNTMYHRINDLECQRDIYKSRSESWEREASGWHDVTMQLGELTDDLREELKSKEQSLPANFTMEYAGDFLCTSYCTEKREHICGTGTGITASGAPVEAGVTVAADQSIFPFGTVLYIESVGVRIVQDKGADIQCQHLDVAVAGTHEDALNWPGYGTHKVWIIEENDNEDCDP